MNVALQIQIGLKGTPHAAGTLWLDALGVGQAADLFGLYHIHVMDRHYDDYVVTPFLPGLPAVVGYPPAHPYLSLTGKIRAAGVTGNIGESVTGALAQQFLGLQVCDIAHIRPNQAFSRRKAPDFLLRCGPLDQTAAPSLWPTLTPPWPFPFSGSPEWWPTESKARTTAASTKQAVSDAFRQIAAYWHTIHQACPGDVGYGLIVALTYHAPQNCKLIILIPTNKGALSGRLQATTYKTYLEELDDDATTYGALSGC